MRLSSLLSCALIFVGALCHLTQVDAQGLTERGLAAVAEGGDAEAEFQLGLRYITGKGLKADPKAGLKWLEKAASQGHSKAMLVIGSLYEDGDKETGLTQDFNKAAEWYQKAAAKDLPEAQYQLALLYIQGKGVKAAPEKAAEWFQKAALNGHAPSQSAYAGLLIEGEGVKKNPAKAALWFLKAAKQDNGYAQRKLANLYFVGLGVPVDYKRCAAWYRRAASDPEDPWAKNDLAWFLAACPDVSFHSGKEATNLAKEAVKMIQERTGENRHEVVDTVAAALARSGEYAEAVIWQREALKLLAKDADLTPVGRKELEKEFHTRLDLYTAKKPYTDAKPTTEVEGEPLPNDTVLEDVGRPKLKESTEEENEESNKPRKNVTLRTASEPNDGPHLAQSVCAI
jgi:TPR repeat protein